MTGYARRTHDDDPETTGKLFMYDVAPDTELSLQPPQMPVVPRLIVDREVTKMISDQLTAAPATADSAPPDVLSDSHRKLTATRIAHTLDELSGGHDPVYPIIGDEGGNWVDNPEFWP